MAEEKANHFATCIGPSWIGVTTQGTAPRPSMASSVYLPPLEYRAPPCINVEGSGVGMSSGYPTAMHVRLHARNNIRLCDDVIAVARMHGGVAIAVEHDGRDNPFASLDHRDTGGALSHRREGGGKVAGDPASEAGVHTHCRI